MFRQTVLMCYVFFMALTPFIASAAKMTPEQQAKIRDYFEKAGLECTKVVSITDEDIANLRARKLATGDNVPCFLACLMKKSGVMDDKGVIQNENALDLAKQVFHDPAEIQNIQNYLHSCSSVNEKAMGDGDKGCERALLAYKCMLENAPQFEFLV